MGQGLARISDKAMLRTTWARLACLLFVAAAGVWLVGCSEASRRGLVAPLPSTPSTYETTAGKASAAPKGGLRPAALTVSDKGQGGITIKATWVIPGSPEASSQLNRYLAFSLALETHSGDLGQYDLKKLATLRDDKGKELSPASWQPTSDDSHHRAGILRFAKGIEQGGRYLELVVRDVGGVSERALRWDLGG